MLINGNVEMTQEKNRYLGSMISKTGLEINKENVKIMKNLSTQEKKVYMEDTVTEKVEHFEYLKSYLDQEGGKMKEVRARIEKAALAFKNLEKI